jgi:eukaryotic-like serine/threonine-protein kinase
MSTLEVPATIGRYKIENELGRGTMGVVYRAFDPVLGRPIALKTILLDHLASEKRESYERRFLSEARIAAQLSHPGIVVVHDIGRDAPTGLLYIALELLEGESLSHILAARRLPAWQDSLRIVARVATALNHAHARGVVHRDIKPANIMIQASGHPKIMDFGIAKLEQSSTVSTELCGTPLYMSPEQATGQTVDARSDLFSLGSIGYALLTGIPPFRADTIHAILARVTYQEPPAPSERVAGLPPEIDYVILRAMAKQPEERYASGQALAEDIDDVLAGLPPRNRQSWKPPERGDLTIASGRLGATQHLEDLALEPVDEPAPKAPPPTAAPRQRSVSMPLFLLLLAVAALYHQLDPTVLQYWRDTASALLVAPRGVDSAPPLVLATSPPLAEIAVTPAPTAEPSLSPTAPPDEQEEPAVDEPETGTPPSDEPAPAVAPRPEPSQAPTAEAQPTKRATPRPTPTPRPVPARLAIEFRHGLKSGTLRVWVDGKPILAERLSSRVTRKILIFETRKGFVEKALTLTPGRHEIRVTVQSGKVHQGGRLRTTFHSGVTKRLAVVYNDGSLAFYWRKS